MAFTKAHVQQSKLRISFYGPPGSGKTFTSLLVAEGIAAAEGKRVAYIDTEVSGTDFYAVNVPERTSHPNAFDFDLLKTQSLSEAIHEATTLSHETHSVIVVDSITHMWEAAMNAYEARTKADTIPMHAWGKIKKPYKKFVKWLMECPFHVILCGRQKNVFEGQGDDFRKIGVMMAAEKDTQYEPQACIRLDARVDQKDTTRTTYYAYVEKDRTGILAGRTLANLTYKHFAPVLALLGGEQFHMTDDDDIAMRDGELLDKADAELQEKKAAKSAELLASSMAAINKAADLNELGKCADVLKVKRGQLLSDHYKVLREAYDTRAAKLRGDTQ